MRVSKSSGGLTVRAIAGTHNILLGIDLEEGLRKGCLGFSIQRARLDPKQKTPPQWTWLPNRLRFPKDKSTGPISTERSPVQKFRWGDYTVTPGTAYRYRVVARYGSWDRLTSGATVELDLKTEDPSQTSTAVFFNRGAAASQAYNDKFGNKDPDKMDPQTRQTALTWLSRGLEEALLAFLAQARGKGYALHAAIYEFQKPELLAGLVEAAKRGVEVKAVYHDRKATAKDTTWQKNEAAAAASKLAQSGAQVHQRKADPQGAISHNKFVVLLRNGTPKAIWTGSTNWTEGAIYGQLNVGHAVYDEEVADTYEKYFQLLFADAQARQLKAAARKLSPVLDQKTLPPGPGVWPILSPQANSDMLSLYASLCEQANHLMVCAPFALAPVLLDTFSSEHTQPGTLHYLLVDKESSLGKPEQVRIIEGDPSNEVGAATTLSSPLHDFQKRILMTPEHFHHAGIHIHSKIIAVNPLGPDPIIITGSANYSNNSTLANDENSLMIRGDLAVADIYVTEFMRMFEHYHFRGAVTKENAKRTLHGLAATDTPLSLREDDTWTDRFYVEKSADALGRQLFAGTEAPSAPAHPEEAHGGHAASNHTWNGAHH
ncbi:phospholipase D-like domain-containing protein [Vitiosangium sp. GDMCC 1.1324]|uniref:phospholipase D-like domain-containing protein n=1 Tax=Vitiosangium sp. (strain GDMCC 1.1324) TaxID=2138576 RepID=UPI00130EEB70|nr:phospholipase D-like domain-containing protein [Vitiosangium sp. GDMCC 1.1324]